MTLKSERVEGSNKGSHPSDQEVYDNTIEGFTFKYARRRHPVGKLEPQGLQAEDMDDKTMQISFSKNEDDIQQKN